VKLFWNAIYTESHTNHTIQQTVCSLNEYVDGEAVLTVDSPLGSMFGFFFGAEDYWVKNMDFGSRDFSVYMMGHQPPHHEGNRWGGFLWDFMCIPQLP
jgi:hypothetical protein